MIHKYLVLTFNNTKQYRVVLVGTNMAAVSLFRSNNVAAVTSCETSVIT